MNRRIFSWFHVRAHQRRDLLADIGWDSELCSAHPGTAIVGDTRISEADVSLTSQQLFSGAWSDVVPHSCFRL